MIDEPLIELEEREVLPLDDEPSSDGTIQRRIEIVVPIGKTPERLDQFLARQVADMTRSKAAELIDAGGVMVDGAAVKRSHKVRPREVIELTIAARPSTELQGENIPLKVVYEDHWLIVIDKPAGLVVHPAAGNRTGTLVNALLWRYAELADSSDPERPGIVHRIDKDTSGLLVVCKREPAMSRMSELFREHRIDREYNAIAWWPLPTRKGVVDQPIGRDPTDRKKMAVVEGGKHARTHWLQLEKFDFLTFVALKLETGRTHQIRVHLSHTGHPMFGDADYGGRNRQMGRLSSAQRIEAAEYLERINRQMLHARTLGFEHPITGEKLLFESPLPEDFLWLLENLREKEAGRKRAVEEPE